MAPYRRILSPYETNSSEACHDELCRQSSYFYTPPSPITTITAVSSRTQIEIVHKNRHIPTLIVAVAVAASLATFFLLLTYFAILLKSRSSRRRRTTPVTPQPPVPDDGFNEEEDTETLTHHVWYIRTTGLDEPTIDSITICVYKSGDGLIDGTDCSVCLSEFREGELVRLLPKCSHAFHIPCIDTWLKSHVNCPLCRAHIVNINPSSSSSEAPVDRVPRADISPDEDLNVPSFEGSRVSSMCGIGQPGMGIGLGRNSSLPNLASGCRPMSDLQDGRADKLYGTPVAGDVEVNSGQQPVRRSFSMDLSSVGTYLPRVGLGGISGGDSKRCNFEEGSALNIGEKLGSGSKGASLQKDSLGIGRSLSSSGGMFFLSRYARGRNSILPM